MLFEWDPGKASANLEKHGLDFAEAASVFMDPLAMTYRDPQHSRGESRFITLGWSSAERLIFVAHLDREDRIRIISARRATRRERHDYEEQR